jgi:hypothetical protein
MAAAAKTNNPHGRPKGAKNKATADIKATISALVHDRIAAGQFSALWGALDPKDQAKLLTELLRYAVPPCAPAAPEDAGRKEEGKSLYDQLNEAAKA